MTATTPETRLVAAHGLRKHFRQKGGFGQPPAIICAVDDVSFEIGVGDTLGIVGESGCGKSTIARLMLHLVKPDAGHITFEGDRVGSRTLPMRRFRAQAQMVFQDSHSSLNPRLTVEDSVAFGPVAHGASWRNAKEKARTVLSEVGLAAETFGDRYPHELSGGQRQRVNIARALVLYPRLIVFDEAVSALDKSIEAQVLALIQELKARLGLTYVFISHDLNVVRHVSNRVMIMYLGKVVEIGAVQDVYRHPSHPYTQALLESRPTMDPDRRTQSVPLSGDPPNPIDPPSGCRFRTRCPFAMDICSQEEPALDPMTGADTHHVACHAVSRHARRGKG